MQRREAITDDKIASKCGWTPFHGKTVTGWPVMTVIRGRQVMVDGEIAGPAQGDVVRFWEGV